jgi:hypothetical protein
MSTDAPKDDLDAIRAITNALSNFKPDEQKRILNYACQKLGIVLENTPPGVSGAGATGTGHRGTQDQGTNQGRATDIRTFVQDKQPKTDIQFATTVAYFYRFVALADQRKDNIGSADLIEACRAVNHERIDAKNTFNNAYNAGLLDRVDRGKFAINTVGENLVAMTLPGGDIGGNGSSIARRKPRKANKTKKKRK